MGSSLLLAPELLDERLSEGEEVDARRAVSTIWASRARKRKASEGCFVRGSSRGEMVFSVGFVRADNPELAMFTHEHSKVTRDETTYPPIVRVKGSEL